MQGVIATIIFLFVNLGCMNQNDPEQGEMLDYRSLAKCLVERIDPQPGERVWMLAHPDLHTSLIDHLREQLEPFEITDLGVSSVTIDSPDHWSTEFTRGMEGLEVGILNSYLSTVDLGIMLPGASTADAAYVAMQDVLRSGKGRTVHFHWSGAYDLDHGLMEITPSIDSFYQQAVLETNYRQLSQHQETFEAAMRGQVIRVTTPAGTDLRFEIGDRPVTLQDGNASAARAEEAENLIDLEIEIPAGAIRVAPIEESVNGQIAFPDALWNGSPVTGLLMTFGEGKVVNWEAQTGSEHVAGELQSAGPEGRAFREFALGFNPLLTIPQDDPWIPYYGYGAGVVRLSLGDNTELGGLVGGGYVRWNFFIDATVFAGDQKWVEEGHLIR